VAQTEIATLAGGCFWCLEAVFAGMKGVESVESGYMGGRTPDPDYHQVCTGRTGHAEVVRLRFDPAAVTFRELLDVFFAIHDPTTLNRQGNDRGTQYRSAIFYESETQRTEAETAIAELTREGVFTDPIVTEVTPASAYYPAEAYHQNYFADNPAQPYCAYVVAPKVQKFRKQFAEKCRT
jgi:peptide-methionine (S)-S-oxide reductase